MAAGDPIIIVKKHKKANHDLHHGGAWKVAYADFVTAMMAFFLLLWLLSATTPKQRAGISNYFAPASVSKTTSGSGAILGGTTMTKEGALNARGEPIQVPLPKSDQVADPSDDDADVLHRVPEMDGPTMLAQMREKNPDLKIIFVSGYAEDAFEKSLPEGQQFNFLPKPFTLSQLVAAVKETMTAS